MKKLILKFNGNPETTLRTVVEFSNGLGLLIEKIEDLKKTKAITHKIVTITGEGISLKKMKDMLVRVPAVTAKEE
jgi:hypothetical protein